MNKATQAARNHGIATKWVALEDGAVIAEGIDLAEVYTKSMMKSKSKPQFKRVPIQSD